MGKKTEVTQVHDEHSTVYELIKKLGEGGQGAVYSTQHPNILVKLLKVHKDKTVNTDFMKKINSLKRLDLTHMNISLPVAMLAGEHTGYIMELMDEMSSITDIMQGPHQENQEVVEWLQQTGGIERRIILLRNLAKILVDLHSEGLAYGDLSPANIFISDDTAYSEVQLIDCDNITSTMSFKDVYYTKFYGAPEIVNRKNGYTSSSDAWSFAVIAFQLLTLNHPFKGLAYEDGDPDLVDDDLDHAKYPWILDEEDDSNQATTSGLPADLTISKNMMKLFKKTFEKKENDGIRPGMQEWLEVLNTVTRSFNSCSNKSCDQKFLYSKQCPYCESRRNVFIKLKVVRWEPKLPDNDELENSADTPILSRYMNKVPQINLPMAILNLGESLTVAGGLFNGYAQDESSLEFHYEINGNLKIIPSNDTPVTIRLMDGPDSPSFILGKEKLLGRPIEKKPGNHLKNYAIHLGEVNEPHRVILFKWKDSFE